MRMFFSLLLAALFGWPVITALRTGRVYIPAGNFERSSHPITYGTSLTIGTLMVLGLVAAGFGLFPGQSRFE